jgi:hypothetical protein
MPFNLPSGIAKKQFDKIWNHWKRDITINRLNAQTSNISGDNSNSYGSDENIQAIFLKRNQKYSFLKEGFLEMGDAYIMVRYSDISSELKLHDKVTVDSEIYEVENSINRFDIFYYVVLIKID